MTVHYADASAWGKLIHDEAESEAMLDHLEEVRREGGRFVSSALLLTELHRIAARLGLPTTGVVDALGEISLEVPTRETFELAARLPGLTLRSLDAVHVAAALETGAEAFITYDTRQAAAAGEAGLAVLSPGA